MRLLLQHYPSYKDSYIPWLGSIPSHWRLERPKNLFDKMSRPPRPNDEVITCFRDGMVTLRKNRRLTGFTESIEEIGYQGVRKGDLIIHQMDAFAGAVGVSDSDGKCTPVYAVCRPRNNINSQYFAYLVGEMSRKQWITALARGIRERSTDFRFDTFSSQIVVVPSVDEQLAIVQFLVNYESRTNRLIRVKRQMIELLNEQRNALIERAVTCGLNPHVKSKSSDIPWLASIPLHWGTRRSKYLFREIDKRSTTGQEARLSMSQKLGLVPSSQVKEIRLVAASSIGAKICCPNDLILNRLKAHLGVFSLSSYDGIVSPDYTVLRAIAPIDHKYFELVYRTPACRVELKKRAKGIVEGFWRLYTDDFYNIRVPVPPLDEQRNIVAHIEAETKQLSTTISRIRDEIELIREYRTRLISDVVTGQTDVRAAAALLLQEIEPVLDIEDIELAEDESLEESHD